MSDHTNTAAFKRAQAAYDNMTPDDDGGRSDFIEEQVALLMEGEDAREVSQGEYLIALDEAMADGECGSPAEVVLAVMNGENNMAAALADKMSAKFEEIAVKLIEEELDK
ncbi:MAG: hypothetical protein K5804_17800 [Microbacterium sp.]|uniref:hypothetical protein n=1 Tax=Microbacterium sp. TaxID=51671 RepID=UPI002608AA3B|nr:hypothetical protein [Microbacterium sp.]MCV0420099.1 hypothetical protein [Microbacterium sp.]